ncbi:MAG: hypothetical protein PUK45_03435, partial [Clostridia bacterium]|nr:hypothetical protein [Clostridia bacterium]
GTHTGVPRGHISSKSAKQNGVSCQYMTAAPFCFVLRLPLAAGAHLRISADHSQMRFSRTTFRVLLRDSKLFKRIESLVVITPFPL